MNPLDLDPTSQFVRNVVSYAGREGRHWLDELPRRITDIAEQWQLSDIEPCQNLSFNFVARAMQAQQQVVLKIGWVHRAMQRESCWLSHYGGLTTGLTVPILARDADDAYLMLGLEPGSSLNLSSDEIATEIIGQCIQAISTVSAPPPEEVDFPTIEDWFLVLKCPGDASRQTLGHRIDHAIDLAQELSRSGERHLLHGDLHHTNVLKHADDWIVTDPHGVLGDPVHECAAMLRNGLSLLGNSVTNGVCRRVDQLAAMTGYDADRIAAWGMLRTYCPGCGRLTLTRVLMWHR